MKSQGQIRLEIYNYVGKLLGRDITEEEHIYIKKLLTEHKDIERAKEAVAHLNKIESLKNKIKSLKYSNKPKKEKPSTIRVWTPTNK